MEDDQKKWKTNQSTKINLIGCDTIVNSPSLLILTENLWTSEYKENKENILKRMAL